MQDDWKNALIEVQNTLAGATDKTIDTAARKAQGFVEQFLAQLRHTTVLDPACGTGNFLYVAMELMKRLEAEAVETLVSLGGQAPLLGVDPEQFLGLELNPRAARVAELVLWIGYLQLYTRAHGLASPPEPILRAFHNIRQQDAVLAFTGVTPKVDKDGQAVTRWDGIGVALHPLTGREVPDPEARVQDQVYDNPGAADWPEATFIVSNPPFIGPSVMRFALGDGYTETLRKTYPQVSESSDFVMYWWHKAALLLAAPGSLRRFGFVTTNSLKQTFNRRVLERALTDDMSLSYAVPDHPWVDEADGAAVRIALTAARRGRTTGVLSTVGSEAPSGNGAYDVETTDETGVINADLTVGVDVTVAQALKAMDNVSNPGIKLHGSGFIVTLEEALKLGLGRREGLERHIREYRNGKDLTHRPRGVMVIDMFGLSANEVRERYPEVYQHVFVSVKPERDQNNRASYRDNWWIFGEPRSAFRPALANLPRYIATVETSKHRFFQFLDASILPDNKLIAIAHDDAYVLGVLSSRIHVTWALAQGSDLGPTPVYVKTRCFETFPFPDASAEQRRTIADLAEQLDAFRKARLAEHPSLTMTLLYNVLEQLRAGTELSAKDRRIHDDGLVTTLLGLHDDLDTAVAAAYGWLPALSQQEVLGRLTQLNAVRRQEEKAGLVRYLRPAYQDPKGAQQNDLGITLETPDAVSDALLEFPGRLAEQAQAVRQVLLNAQRPLSTKEIAGYFRAAKGERLEEIVEMFVELGQARQLPGLTPVYAA